MSPHSDVCQANHKLGLDNAHKYAYNDVVKRRELIKILESDGWYFSRHGKLHDIYRKGDRQEAIPRHTEINENLAKAILSRNNILKKEKQE